MKITDIYNQFSAKKYQNAVINYLSYSYLECETNDYSRILVQSAIRKLRYSLTERASVLVSSLNVTERILDERLNSISLEPQFNLWAELCDADGLQDISLTGEALGWSRLDFIVGGGSINQKGIFSLSLWNDGAFPIVVEVPFVFNICQTMLFPSPAGIFYETPIEKDINVDGCCLSLSLISLRDFQVVEHLFEEFRSEYRLGHLNEFLKLCNNSDEFLLEIHKFQRSYINNYFFSSKNIFSENNFTVYRKLTSSIDNILINYKKNSILIGKDIFENNYGSNSVESLDQLGYGIEFYFDVLYRLGNLYVLYGWLTDPSEQISAIRLIGPSGRVESELLNEFVYFERLDVVQYLSQLGRHHDAKHGFACVVNCLDDIQDINVFTKRIETVTCSGKKFITTVSVTNLPNDSKGLSEAMRIVPSTAMSPDICEKLYKRLFMTQMKLTEKIEEFFNETYSPAGVSPTPRLSIIVPLFGSVRFELTHMPTIATLRQLDWELIFAVDDPEILDDVKTNVRRLAEYYGITAKVIAPTCNLGFSGINNFAVERCSANMLLFLNSDCFLTQSDSIIRAMDRLDRDQEMGAVGFRLLYSDHTIQHDGMSVERWEKQQAFFINAHPRQGMPNKLIPEYVVSDTSCLLTAACLLMPRPVFEGVGGFDTRFFLGDFEDSDLCLKILETGKKLGIVREEGIFHLERQSFKQVDSLLRQRITLTNSNIYSNRWRAVLEDGLLAPLTVL